MRNKELDNAIRKYYKLLEDIEILDNNKRSYKAAITKKMGSLGLTEYEGMLNIEIVNNPGRKEYTRIGNFKIF